MKNLKKVISSVIAFALSASSFAALSASAATSVFPDVDPDGTYADAINDLYALGIVSGDDTGNFNPDSTITRAEVTKMIVEAFSRQSNVAQTSTDFTDVTSSHWASGYIAYGVSQGFINGMGDGTFAPESNVTYAQVIKLIVGAMGYTTDAENNGGYPTGYLYYATSSSLKVTDGVSGLANDTAVTRAQVAQLIDNAIDAPLSVYSGSSTDVWGNPVSNYTTYDGTGQYYKSALTEYHDVYVIEGRVTGTSADGTVKSGEVAFQVEYARRWDKDGSSVNSYFESGYTYGPYTIQVGDTDADQYPFTYATAYVFENDDDDWEFLTFTTSTQNVEVTFDADDFDDENKNYDVDDDGNIGSSILDLCKIYVSNPKTNYTLATDFDLVVNNVVIEHDYITADMIQTYLVDEAVGTVTLIDSAATSGSSTDGKYDYVKVNYYENAVVSGVQQTSDGYRILLTDFLRSGTFKLSSSLTLYDDNDDYTWSVKLADENGDTTVIDPLELAEDDVVSVAYNINYDPADSPYLEIIASRNIVEGTVSSYSSDDETYTMNSVAYGVDAYANNNYTAGTDIVSGSDYEFKLDAFGRIHSSEETASSKIYGIVDRVYTDSSSDEKRIRIVTENGGTTTYVAKNTSVYEEAYDICYDSEGNKYPAEERVVQYKTASSGSKLNTIDAASATVTTGEYKASTNRVGSLRISTSAVVIDASEAYVVSGNSVYDDDDYSTSDFKASSASTFVDGETYTIIAANRSTSDYNYRFIVIAENENAFSMENSVLAVVKSVGTGDLDGTTYDTLEVYQGEDDSVTLYYEDDTDDFAKGDVITYNMGSEGYIESGDVVLLYSAPSSSKSYSLASILEEAYEATKIDDLYGTDVDSGEEGFFRVTGIYKWDVSESGNTAGYARVAIAPIVSRSSSSIVLGKLTEEDGSYVTYDDDQLSYGYASDVRITVINYANSGSNMIYNGQSGDIVATSYSIAQDKASGTINWSDSNLADYTNMALVKMYEGDITDIVILVAPEMG